MAGPDFIIDRNPDPKRRPLRIVLARWLIVTATRSHDLSQAYVTRECHAIREAAIRESERLFTDGH